LDQGQESESAGSYPRHRRYDLDKFSSLNARIYCSWHRFETFQQGRLPELSPDCLLPLPPGSQSDESPGRAAANHGPVALSFERSELTKRSRNEIDMNAEIRAIFLGLVFAALSWAAILAVLYEP
jgi:hypothetical protein